MALIKCPNCGKDISDRVSVCPKCNFDMEAYYKKIEQEKLEEEKRKQLEEQKRQEEEERRKQEEARKEECPECGVLVDKDVENCPNCGFPIKEEKLKKVKINEKRKRLIGVISGAVILLISIIYFVSLNNNKKIYEDAIVQFEKGNYYDAKTMFDKLGTYKSSQRYSKIAELGDSLEYLAEDISNMDATNLNYYTDIFEESSLYAELYEIRHTALMNLKSEAEKLSEYTHNYDSMNKASSICTIIDPYLDIDELSELCYSNFIALYREDNNETSSESNTSTGDSDEKKEPYIGMSAFDAEYNCTWGRPADKNITTTEYGTSEQWVYGGRYIYIDDGVVTAIQE